MRLHGRFPNTEAAMVAFVEHVFPQLSVYTEIPDDFDDENIPAALVTQPPGGAGFETEEYETAATVDVEFYAATRAEVWDLVQDFTTALPTLVSWGDVALDEVRLSNRFGIQPYENPRMRRGMGSVDLVARPQ